LGFQEGGLVGLGFQEGGLVGEDGLVPEIEPGVKSMRKAMRLTANRALGERTVESALRAGGAGEEAVAEGLAPELTPSVELGEEEIGSRVEWPEAKSLTGMIREIPGEIVGLGRRAAGLGRSALGSVEAGAARVGGAVEARAPFLAHQIEGAAYLGQDVAGLGLRGLGTGLGFAARRATGPIGALIADTSPAETGELSPQYWPHSFVRPEPPPRHVDRPIVLPKLDDIRQPMTLPHMDEARSRAFEPSNIHRAAPSPEAHAPSPESIRLPHERRRELETPFESLPRVREGYAAGGYVSGFTPAPMTVTGPGAQSAATSTHILDLRTDGGDFTTRTDEDVINTIRQSANAARLTTTGSPTWRT
jgi:hypothetical protein